MSERTTINRGLLELIVQHIAQAPDREADPHVKRESREAVAQGLDTLAEHELFDIVQRIGDREPHCEVSPFVAALCDLKRYYVRPASMS